MRATYSNMRPILLTPIDQSIVTDLTEVNAANTKYRQTTGLRITPSVRSLTDALSSMGIAIVEAIDAPFPRERFLLNKKLDPQGLRDLSKVIEKAGFTVWFQSSWGEEIEILPITF